MEQRNEPTTAECCVEDQLREIVRKTRAERLAFVPLDTGALLRIADIIEGLERENAELSKKALQLTARAEKAEAERDAAVANLFQAGSTDEETEGDA